MLVDGLAALLWSYAILFGGLSFIAIAAASYARRRFRACLNAPLTRSSGDRSQMWAEMVTFWHWSGLGMAGVSILCTVLSRIL
jgi:hypothetical protein